MRYYIAGPMRGLPNNNFDRFQEALMLLRLLFPNDEFWSPAVDDIQRGFDPSTSEPSDHFLQESFRRDFSQVTQSDGMILLEGWTDSEGALSEVDVALKCGLNFIYFGVDNKPVVAGPEGVKLLLESAHAIRRAPSDTYTHNEIRVHESKTGGKKGTKNVRIDLIPPAALQEVGLNYGIGAARYGEHNWQKGYPYSLSIAALHRHLNLWQQGEERDDDGFLHLAAVVFHACTLIYRDKNQQEWDDVHGE